MGNIDQKNKKRSTTSVDQNDERTDTKLLKKKKAILYCNLLF